MFAATNQIAYDNFLSAFIGTCCDKNGVYFQHVIMSAQSVWNFGASNRSETMQMVA